MTEINEDGLYDAATVAEQWGTGFSEGALQAMQAGQTAAAAERAVAIGISAFDSGLYDGADIAKEIEKQFGSQTANQFISYWTEQESTEPEPLSAEQYVAEQNNLSETLRELSARMQVNRQAQEEQARFDATYNAIGEVLDKYPDATEHRGVLEETVKLLTPDTDPETTASFVETGIKVGREQQRVIAGAERVAAAQNSFKQIDVVDAWNAGLSGRESRGPTAAEWQRHKETRIADRANEIIAKSELNLRNIVPETGQEIAESAAAPIVAKLSRARVWDDEVNDSSMSARENRGRYGGGEIGTDRPKIDDPSTSIPVEGQPVVDVAAAAEARTKQQLRETNAWWA
jgi:hypothetical protein